MSEIPYPPASAVSRLIRIAISSFLSALLLCSVAWAQSPNAEDASGESVIEAQVDSGPYPLTVRVLPPDDVNREAPRLQVWVEEQSTAALDVEIPQFLVVQPSPPELRALWTEVRGGPGLLRLDISVVSSINRSIWSLVLVAPTRARGEFQYLWSGRHNEEGYGEYLTVEDLDGDDRDEVVTYVRDRQLPVCARPDVLLLPRVYDPRRDVFRPVSLRVDPSDDAQELVPVHESFPDHFSADSEWTAVSSDGSIPVTRNYGPVPDAIVDGDVSTSWIEGAAGAGVGQFFHGVVIDEVSLRGIWLHNGRYDGGVGPTRILIILGDGSEFTASLEPYGPHYLEFPEPIDGIDCLNLVVLDAPEEAESVEIAELHPVTELDMRPIERALTLMLLPLLYENQNTLREAVIADVIASGGPAIFDTLDEELLEASPEDQPALVGPYMRIRGGRDRLLERVSQLELESQTVAEIRRRLTGLDPEDSSTLVRYANEAVDDELRSQLLSVLARSVAPEQAIELASMAGIGSQADRDQVVDALARIPIEDIGEILAYLPAGATERNIDLLRAAITTARRNAAQPHQPTQVEAAALRQLLVDDNGSVARLAVALVGRMPTEALFDDIRALSTEDPQPNLRLEAIDALGRVAHAGIRVEDARETLFGALTDENPSVRIEAADALRGLLDEPSALSMLTTIVPREPWPEARRALLSAAIDVNSPDTDAAIVAFLRDADSDDVRSALRLFQSRSPRPEGGLLLQLASRWEEYAPMRTVAYDALAVSAGTGADAYLAQTLAAAAVDSEGFSSLVEACGRRRIEAAYEHIVALLDDPEAGPRRAAARSLGYFADDRTVLVLESALEDEEDVRVRNALETSLGMIRTSRQLDDAAERIRRLGE